MFKKNKIIKVQSISKSYMDIAAIPRTAHLARPHAANDATLIDAMATKPAVIG